MATVIRSFRDPVTNRLKAWGKITFNQPGDISQAEPESFNLNLITGVFEWNGSTWVTVPPATLAVELLARQRAEATGLLSSPEGTLKLLRAAFDVARDEINVLRSILPRPILSITRTGTVATVTTYVAHGLTNGTVFITGADVAAYNGSKAITVTGATTFTFTVAGTPATPAAGSMSFILATVTTLAPRTFAQFVTAIQARIADGTVD